MPPTLLSVRQPHNSIPPICYTHTHTQVEQSRLLTDSDGLVWLRIEDAGYMDREGRIWLVGRVKWRVETGEETFWSVIVEQKVHITTEMCNLKVFFFFCLWT